MHLSTSITPVSLSTAVHRIRQSGMPLLPRSTSRSSSVTNIRPTNPGSSSRMWRIHWSLLPIHSRHRLLTRTRPRRLSTTSSFRTSWPSLSGTISRSGSSRIRILRQRLSSRSLSTSVRERMLRRLRSTSRRPLWVRSISTTGSRSLLTAEQKTLISVSSIS